MAVQTTSVTRIIKPVIKLHGAQTNAISLNPAPNITGKRIKISTDNNNNAEPVPIRKPFFFVTIDAMKSAIPNTDTDVNIISNTVQTSQIRPPPVLPVNSAKMLLHRLSVVDATLRFVRTQTPICCSLEKNDPG